MSQLDKLKEKFEKKATKEETPPWVTKLVDDLRSKKPGDDDFKKQVEAEVAKNLPKDASEDDKKAAYKQVSREMQKQAQEHTEDAGFLKDKSKLIDKGIATVVESVLSGDKNPLKKIKIPFGKH